MSALQFEKILEDSHRIKKASDGQNKQIHLFVYDRKYRWTKFQKEFPKSPLAGVGWLKGWEWIVQTSGNANIRPVYGFDTKVAGFTAQEQSQEGTFGYIFQVSAVDLEAVRKGYRGTRVMLTTNIDVALNHWSKDKPFEIVTFYDPYDTVSTTVSTINNNPVAAKEWIFGCRELSLLGCPKWYLTNIYNTIIGQVPIPSSLPELYINPDLRNVNVQQHPIRPIDQLRVRQSNTEQHRARQVNQVQRGPAPSAPLRSNLTGNPAPSNRVLSGNPRVSKAGQNARNAQRPAVPAVTYAQKNAHLAHLVSTFERAEDRAEFTGKPPSFLKPEQLVRFKALVAKAQSEYVAARSANESN